MLMNYDAQAIADAMGIAFVEDPDASAGNAARGPHARGAAHRTTPSGRLVVEVAHRHVWIVDRGTNPEFAPGHRRKRTRGAVSDFTVRPASPDLIEKAVEQGLPRLALRHVAEHIAGDDKAKISALEWTIVPKSTLERRDETLSPLESERTERVARLLVHARRALGSEAEARDFMTAPHPLLDARTPIDAAKTDLGTRRTEHILNALEYGLAL